jgi:hypothetical protein
VKEVVEIQESRTARIREEIRAAMVVAAQTAVLEAEILAAVEAEILILGQGLDPDLGLVLPPIPTTGTVTIREKLTTTIQGKATGVPTEGSDP